MANKKTDAAPGNGAATQEKTDDLADMAPKLTGAAAEEHVKAVPDKDDAEEAKEVQVSRGRTTTLGVTETRKILKRQKVVEIMIPSTETEKDAVSVGVNGYFYLIQRDERVKVPESVAEVLRNAVMTVYTQKAREGGEEGNELVPHDAMRIPFQTYGEVAA